MSNIRTANVHLFRHAQYSKPSGSITAEAHMKTLMVGMMLESGYNAGERNCGSPSVAPADRPAVVYSPVLRARETGESLASGISHQEGRRPPSCIAPSLGDPGAGIDDPDAFMREYHLRFPGGNPDPVEVSAWLCVHIKNEGRAPGQETSSRDAARHMMSELLPMTFNHNAAASDLYCISHESQIWLAMHAFGLPLEHRGLAFLPYLSGLTIHIQWSASDPYSDLEIPAVELLTVTSDSTVLSRYDGNGIYWNVRKNGLFSFK